MAQITMAKALTNGLRAAMEADPTVLIMGEDVGKLGGVFRVTDGLQKDFGEQRVLDTPLAESGIIGTAVGLALRGFRPVWRTESKTGPRSSGESVRRSITSSSTSAASAASTEQSAPSTSRRPWRIAPRSCWK